MKKEERKKRKKEKRKKGVPAWFCLRGSTRWSGWINAVTFTVSSTLPHDTSVLAALRREGWREGVGGGGLRGTAPKIHRRNYQPLQLPPKMAPNFQTISRQKPEHGSRRTDGRPPRATLLMATSTNHLFLFRRGVGDSGSSSRSSKAEN